MATIVQVNKRGSLTLLAEVRRHFNLQADAILMVEKTPEGILLRPAQAVPAGAVRRACPRGYAQGGIRAGRALSKAPMKGSRPPKYRTDPGLEGEFEPGSRGKVLRNKLGIRTIPEMD